MKNKPLIVRERFNFFQGKLCISSVTLMELAVGAEKSMYKEQAFKALEIFKDSLMVLEFDSNASYHTANIKAVLEKEILFEQFKKSIQQAGFVLENLNLPYADIDNNDNKTTKIKNHAITQNTEHKQSVFKKNYESFSVRVLSIVK